MQHSAGFAPPVPRPPAADLPAPLLLMRLRRNSLRAWPARAYRDLIVHRRFLGTDCFLVNDPAAARRVLAQSVTTYVRPISARRLMRPLAGSGLLTAEGAEWRERRRTIAPAFTPRHVDRLIPQIAMSAEPMLASLEGVSRVRLGEVLERVAIDAAGRTMLSVPLIHRADWIGRLLRTYFNRAARAQIFDFLARSETDYGWFTMRRRALSQRWFAEVDALLAERRNGSGGNDAADLYSLLVSEQDNVGDRLFAEPAARDQVASMLTAGPDTTCRLMFWALYLLAHLPDVQAAVRAELQELPPTEIQSMHDLQRWPRLRSVLLETLRLYPPISVISRVPLVDDVVLDTPIRRGSLVMISPWVMHRHQSLWQSPAIFDADRFMGNAGAHVSEPAFLPFGVGPRACPGAMLAMTEALIILGYLLVRFEVALESSRPVMPVAIVSTVPDHQPWFRIRRLS